MKRVDSFKSNLENNIKSISSQSGQLDYFVVQDVDKTNRVINIKKLNSPITYNKVPIVSMSSIKMPKINNIVVCGFLMNSQQPICLGVTRDILSNSHEVEINDIAEGESVSETKSANSTLIQQKLDGTVLIANVNGNLKLNPDGSITLNNNYTMPLEDGTSGQVMKTDGAGQLYWDDDDTSP